MARPTIEQVQKDLEKKFKTKRPFTRLGDDPMDDVTPLPSGNIALDLALGIGGYAQGRIVEIYGPESSGKTTLAIHAIAETQKQDKLAAFIDAEHAFDPAYAASVGVDIDNLFFAQPSSGEEALEIARGLTETGEFALIVIDSVAGLTPQAEIAGDIGDSHVGLLARMMGQSLRMITSEANDTGTTVIFINQIREKIGVMFGSPETTPGGRALKFFSSQRLDIRRIGALKKGEEIVGNQTRVKVIKNKVAPPFQVAEFDIEYGLGMSQAGTLLDMGTKHGLVQKSGAWYTLPTGEQVQGREAAKEALDAVPEVMQELYDQIWEIETSDD